MTLSPQSRRLLAILCLVLAPPSLLAQRPHGTPTSAAAPAGSYNIANDVSFQGIVLSYTGNSTTPPIGTHVVLQTGSGNVEGHLGDARLLQQAKLNLTPGTKVRLVGQFETVGSSNIFLVRLVQVGTQVVAVRSNQGLPLSPSGSRGKANSKTVSADQQGGAR